MKKAESQTIIINFNMTHRTAVLLMLAVLGVALLGYLAWGSRPVTAANPQSPIAGSTGLRQYYLTNGTFFGNQATTACAPGFHMASLWEIMDTSNLQYTSLGYVGNNDQGNGPPSDGGYSWGWIRTGGASSTSSTPGIGNCANWTSFFNYDFGTLTWLDNNWATVDVWQATTETCDTKGQVWCMEN